MCAMVRTGAALAVSAGAAVDGGHACRSLPVGHAAGQAGLLIDGVKARLEQGGEEQPGPQHLHWLLAAAGQGTADGRSRRLLL